MQRKKKRSFSFNLANFTKSITGGENFDENNINVWINCKTYNPGFDHVIDEQIVGGALGTVSESEEDNYKTQCAVKQKRHEAALIHIIAFSF